MTYFQRTFHKLNADPKPEKTIKPKKAYKYIRKATGEKQIFAEIWKERPHVSQISGEPIHDPQPVNFLHVLPKAQNKYPKFKLFKQAIVLGTADEHFAWDNARHLIDKNDPQWQFMFELEESLKEQYKKLP